MDTTLANTANGANGANGHQPGHGEEMDTDENRDTTRTALLEIMEERAARILEHEKDISAVERVLAILDAGQGAGAHAGEEALGTTEETGPKPGDGETEKRAEEETEAGTEEGTEAGAHTAPADLISDPPAGPSAGPSADPLSDPVPDPVPNPVPDPSADPVPDPVSDPSADPLSIPMDRLKEMAQDTEATAQVFLQARGGEPLDCPRCGSSAQTRRAPGKEQRPDIFRCTPCKAAFGIRTGTAMHSSRETLGTWLTAIRLVADTGGEASGRDLSNLTRTGSKAAADMIAAIRSKMGSPGGLLAAVVRVEGRAKPPERTDAGRETPDPETPDPETPNPETPSGETPSPETPSPETPSRETPSPETPSREMTSPETPSGETTSGEMTSGETESGAAARAALPSGPITELSLDGMKELAGDDIACAGLFMAARDQGGIDCPRCGLREETKRMGAARPAQFRCQICNSIYSVRTGTPIRGLAVSLGKWAMAGYLVATGATPEDEGELTRLIGTTRSMARKIMDTAVQTCPVGQDPIPELVRVTARRPRDAGAEAEADADTDADTDTDTTQQEPRGKTQASQATRADQTAQGEREAREDGRHAGAENGSAGGAGQTEIGQPAPGADILSPDG